VTGWQNNMALGSVRPQSLLSALRPVRGGGEGWVYLRLDSGP
jgi:hypothetical protein